MNLPVCDPCAALRREADAKGAVESEMESIDVIDGFEALGYHGEGREEYSGENSPKLLEDLEAELADNLPADIDV